MREREGERERERKRHRESGRGARKERNREAERLEREIKGGVGETTQKCTEQRDRQIDQLFLTCKSAE